MPTTETPTKGDVCADCSSTNTDVRLTDEGEKALCASHWWDYEVGTQDPPHDRGEVSGLRTSDSVGVLVTVTPHYGDEQCIFCSPEYGRVEAQWKMESQHGDHMGYACDGCLTE